MELSNFVWLLFSAAVSFLIFYLVIKVAVRNAIVEAHRIINTKNESSDNPRANEGEDDSGA